MVSPGHWKLYLGWGTLKWCNIWNPTLRNDQPHVFEQTMDRKMFLRNEDSCLWSFCSPTVRLTHFNSLVNQKTNKIGGIEDKHETVKYPIKLESVEDLDLGVWLGRKVTLTFLCRYLPDNHKFNCREVITKSEAFTFHGIIENNYKRK